MVDMGRRIWDLERCCRAALMVVDDDVGNALSLFRQAGAAAMLKASKYRLICRGAISRVLRPKS